MFLCIQNDDIAAGAALAPAVFAAPAELRPVRSPAFDDLPEGMRIDRSC